jgi:selenocysteine lyase/cysteine desulfurase
MTGTQNHEGLAGVAAAVEYLASLSPLPTGGEGSGVRGRRARLQNAMTAIRTYEQTLSRHLLTGLAERPLFRVLGVRDVSRLNQRVPTISITAKDATPQQMATHLASKQIYSWAGNSYALEVSERLGLEPTGFLRLGLVHYNSTNEIDALLRTLDQI